MPKFAFTASKYASDYGVVKVTLDCQAIVLKPQLGVFFLWGPGQRAQVLNAAMGLTTSESSQIITDVLLRPYAFILEESSLASESLELQASCPRLQSIAKQLLSPSPRAF
jgi:hypothetical protein